MTKKFHILLVILTLGFFATPTLTYACGTKSTKTEKSCCKNHKSKSDKDKNSCNGKCNNSNCSCPTNHCSFALPFWTETKVKTYFAESKKIKNYYNENYLSDGFKSIWTPPKIG